MLFAALGPSTTRGRWPGSWLEPVEKVSTAMLRRGFEALTLATLVLGTSLLEDEKIKAKLVSKRCRGQGGQLAGALREVVTSLMTGLFGDPLSFLEAGLQRFCLLSSKVS